MLSFDFNLGLENPKTRKTTKKWGNYLFLLFAGIWIYLTLNGKHNKLPFDTETNIPAPVVDTGKQSVHQKNEKGNNNNAGRDNNNAGRDNNNAGHDVNITNIYGSKGKSATKKTDHTEKSRLQTLEDIYILFLRKYRDKNLGVAVNFIGKPTADMLSHKETMLTIIAQKGYKKINYEEQYSNPDSHAPIKPYMDLKDSTVTIHIPY